MSGYEQQLRLGFQALALLVREEFPRGHTLAEIAETWPPVFSGTITPAQIEALKALEHEVPRQEGL